MRFNFSDRTADQTHSTSGGTGRLFDSAVALARKGRYEEAGELLQGALNLGQCSQAQALDLQARMYAQQGLHLYAESCWYRAKQFDKSNPAFDSALARLQQSRVSTDRAFLFIVVIAAFAVFGFLLGKAAFLSPELDERLNATQASLTAIRADIDALQKLLVLKINGSSKSDGEADAARAGSIDDITSSLTRLGNVVPSLEGRLPKQRVEPERPVRSSGHALPPESEAALFGW